ncbi:MAG: type II toxin-antitoxin system RelE/ParE family toxin [Saprospiraceae bacterium]|nr:type II toxin-antitoxin system RelE/ParE family toxin [Saprospiraceae bacterium]
MKEYIVYEGAHFSIEWYYNEKGKSEPLKFYEDLDRNQRIQLLELVKLLGDIGQIRNITKFRNEGDGIYAFKPKPNRFLCFFSHQGKVIITNGFTKKADKLTKNHKQKALACMRDYINRHEKGTYYEA